jgi:hypothetical protein
MRPLRSAIIARMKRFEITKAECVKALLPLVLLLLAACGGRTEQAAIATPGSAPTRTPASLPTRTPGGDNTAVAPSLPPQPATATHDTARAGAVDPPAGTIVRVAGEGLLRVGEDGRLQPLLDEETAAQPGLRVAPGGQHAAYVDGERRLWLVERPNGEPRRLAAAHELSFLLLWGDEETLLAGVWLDPSEMEGPNNGHVAAIDRDSGTLTIVDDQNLSGDRPALLRGTGRVALGGILGGGAQIYDPEEGRQRFEADAFRGEEGMLDGRLFNPAWSPDGARLAWLATSGERNALQVYDLAARTARQLFDWDPARMGGMVPSPLWSEDGTWLALTIRANEQEGSGLWLLPAAGGEALLVDALGYEAHWSGAGQLVYNREDGARLYDVASGEKRPLSLPPGSLVVGR